MSLARTTLLQLRRLPVAARNWRPHILVFAGDVDRRIDLVRFAAWLNQDRGILTVSSLLVGDLQEQAPRAITQREYFSRRLDEEGITAFAEVEVVRGFEDGVLSVAQANGIAGISSNTVMFGWSEKIDRLAGTLGMIGTLEAMGKSTVVCRVRPRRWRSRPRRIDVWWGGLENNGDMLLLFAYLLSANPEWKGVEIWVRSIASSGEMLEATSTDLRRMLSASRIDAHTDVTIADGRPDLARMIPERSGDADLVFLGLGAPSRVGARAYAERLTGMIGDLPTVVLVRNGSDFSGQLL